MLNQEYYFYISHILGVSIFSIPGLISTAILITAIVLYIKGRVSSKPRSIAIIWLCLIIGFGGEIYAFYNSYYEFEEDPGSLVGADMAQGVPDCGTAWTGSTKGGYGTGNPCPKGCYRGLTVRKQLRMSGFPPWPNFKRELQCWSYDQ